MKVWPEVSGHPEPVEVLLRAMIEYEGNRDYLPRTISPNALATDELLIQYECGEKEVRSESIEIPSGMRYAMGKASRVAGRLVIRSGSRVIKEYQAVAVLTGSAEFSHETLSEMRRRGLLAVRDNIEAQMNRDKSFLQELTAPSHSNLAR